MAIELGLLISAAYLLGSAPAAYLAARWSRGIDIREYGSGNVGAANLLKFTSKRVAIPIIIFDLGKGMVMVWAAQLMGLGIAQQVMVGLAAIIGHNWPVFLRFNGGRGILTTGGVMFILAPWLLPVLSVIALSFAPFHQLALGVFSGMISAPIAAWFLSQLVGVTDRLPLTLGLLAMFLITLIRRLTAPQTSFAASVPRGELLVNRLLFDRDIRDREAWVHRGPPGVSLENQQGRVKHN